jgi:hypothetical protein
LFPRRLVYPRSLCHFTPSERFAHIVQGDSSRFIILRLMLNAIDKKSGNRGLYK